MKLNNRKSYFSPIAEIVIIDGNDDLLQDGGLEIQSTTKGGEQDEADAKPTFFESRSEIWDE